MCGIEKQAPAEVHGRALGLSRPVDPHGGWRNSHEPQALESWSRGSEEGMSSRVFKKHPRSSAAPCPTQTTLPSEESLRPVQLALWGAAVTGKGSSKRHTSTLLGHRRPRMRAPGRPILCCGGLSTCKSPGATADEVTASHPFTAPRAEDWKVLPPQPTGGLGSASVTKHSQAQNVHLMEGQLSGQQILALVRPVTRCNCV